MLSAVSIEHFQSLKHHTFKKKIIICIICSIICSKCENEKEQSIELLKIIGLFKDI